MDDIYQVITGKFLKGDATFPPGRRVYIIGIPGDSTSVYLRGQSRSGRWVTAWRGSKQLTSFRIRKIPVHKCPPILRPWYSGRDAQHAIADMRGEIHGDERQRTHRSARKV